MKRFTRFFIIILIISSIFVFSGAKIPKDQKSDETFVYLGGIPVGIEVGANGVIIYGTTSIKTKDGTINPLQNSDIKRGDIIISLAGLPVTNPNDITDILSKVNINPLIITIKRGDEIISKKVSYVIDENGNKKLGLYLRENITGIGTLTYIKNDLSFGALGHHIKDEEVKNYDLNRGLLFSAVINGVQKASLNRAGELLGQIYSNCEIGNITNNTDFGIFGTFYGNMTGFQRIQVGNMSDVLPGKAYIYTTVCGNEPEYYEINIIKCNSQQKKEIKSMVISITDNRLIEKTGGIVQGMSGSPIIQNGKLVGAVTHVFINDSTKGYGVYIDWMLQN